jgi:uncharacterized protein (DUF58 family)
MAAPGRSPRVPEGRGGIRLTVRGRLFLIAAIILVIVAYAAGNTVFQLAATLLIVVLIGAVVFVRVGRPRVTAVRTFTPDIVSAGGVVDVTIDVRNRAGRPSARAEWSERIPWSPWAAGGGILPALAPAGARFAGRNATEVRYQLRPAHRGVAEIGPLSVHVEDPFGLVRGSTRAAGTQTLIVTPALVALVDAGLGLSSGEGDARLIQRAVSGNDDDLMTREYRRGDAMRRVHWRVSARHGELMVRQEEQRSKPEVRLAVDTRRSGYSDVSTDVVESETFEWVLRMVASIGVHLRQSGYDVTVLETAAPQIVGFSGGDFLGVPEEGFLASLATIRLADAHAPRASGAAGAGPLFAVVAEPDVDSLAWMLSLRRPGERAIVFLPVWSSAAREAFFAAGWQCVLFRPTDDLATVWADVARAESAR